MRNSIFNFALLILNTRIFIVKSENVAIFTVISPKTILPNSIYNLTISVEEGGGPTKFTASLSSSRKSYSAEEVEINAGTSDVLSLEVNDLPDESYNLTIRSDTSGSKSEEQTIVFVDRKESVVLIQTDKPVYKPGETVMFRIIVLNRIFKPFEGGQTIGFKIYDTSKNVIKSWDKQTITNGLLSAKLVLSLEPNLGDWTIEANFEGKTNFHQFLVDQYVLPKFKVDVKLPPFITFNSSTIRAEIKASYTYGKPLKGECTVVLTRKGYYSTFRDEISKNVPIDASGTATVEFDTVKKDFHLENPNSFYNFVEFELKANVKDELTSREQNGSNTVKMYMYSYKVDQIEVSDFYQPGLPFVMKFRVSSQDNIPIEDPSPDALVVTHGFAYSAVDSISKAPIPTNGIVTFSFNTPSNQHLTVSSVDVKYKELKQTFYLPQKMQSTSQTYLQLTLKSETVLMDQEMELNLKSTKELSSFRYLIYSRGFIWNLGIITLPSPVKEHSFKLVAPAAAAPEGKVIVYSIFGQNYELVAHSVKFMLGSVFANVLDLKLSNDTLEPGQNLTISMKTKANSIVALRGVDQSVLLLKEDKDINLARIEKEMKDMDQQRTHMYRIWGGSGSFQIFEQAGLVVITNALLEKAEWLPYNRYWDDLGRGGFRFRAVGGENSKKKGGMALAMPEAAPAVNKILTNAVVMKGQGETEIRIRKNFQETWLWEEFWLDETNCSMSFDKMVPDTLTSWIITGYSLNSVFGIGVSLEPLILKTFRPFFISLNLPYSVVKGEVLSLQVLVHNYLANEVTASVTLHNNEQKFEFADKNAKEDKLMTHKVKIGASQVSSVKFVIVPIKFGILMLNVNGKTDIAGDGLSQPLTVKPPGHKQTQNKAVLMDLRSGTPLNYDLTTVYPEKRVADADSVKISVIADILGGAISNLDKLLQMPCGCGEQNMLNFVPDIVILDYLTSTKKLTTEIKAQATNFLESGYQRELTYRHYDGSFSAFGNSDPNGSTWLTAFVVRSFVAAKPYITIDENNIAQSLAYLAEKQQADGNFEEAGRVLHSEMQGGSSSTGFALTAYTLLAFIEVANSENSSKQIEDKYSSVIEKGLTYISDVSSHVKVKSDKYALILIAYTLELSKHAVKDTFFDLVEEAALHSGDLTYWEQQMEAQPVETYHPWESYVRPVSVEMTSYALMIYLLRGEVEKSLSIGKWLLKQRNAEGGFLSTQDTVVGLTALSKFAILSSASETNITVTANYEGGSKEIIVNEANSVVLQEFFLPMTTTLVKFEARGQGTALAQLTWTYYVEEEQGKHVFGLNIEAEFVGSKMKLSICAKYIAGNISNMAVVEVHVPSGYAFDQDDLIHLKDIPKMKRYELEERDSKLVVYFDFLETSDTCMKISAQRVFSVGKQAPSYVLVYDYYDTTKKAKSFYDAPKVTSCPVCENDEGCETVNCVDE